MVSERHAMIAQSLLLEEPAEFFLDLPLGQLWSDFDDFYSVGKLLKKQIKNVTLSEIWLPLLTRVIPFWSSKKLSSNSNFYQYDTWFKNSWKTLTCTFILRICLQKKCRLQTFALTDQNSPRNQKIRRDLIIQTFWVP